MKYFDHEVSGEEISVDRSKIEVITDWGQWKRGGPINHRNYDDVRTLTLIYQRLPENIQKRKIVNRNAVMIRFCPKTKVLDEILINRPIFINMYRFSYTDKGPSNYFHMGKATQETLITIVMLF